MGLCAFCRTKLEIRPTTPFFKCPSCGTTMETKLIDRPYLYTVGNGAYLEAPHVPVKGAK